MEDWRSAIKLSKLEVSDAFLPDLEAKDLGGLERELAVLGRRSPWLKSDELETALGRRSPWRSPGLYPDELDAEDADGA